MADYEFAPSAEAEFVHAQNWYAARSQGALDGFVAAMGVAVDRVRRFPDGFPRFDARHRYTVLDGYPYVLYYRPGDPVVIVAVAHSGQRPGYWRGRP